MLTPKSGLLLVVSCVAAIAAVGSVFELAYGMPRFGNTTTGAILVACVPLTVLALWAAIVEARANVK